MPTALNSISSPISSTNGALLAAHHVVEPGVGEGHRSLMAKGLEPLEILLGESAHARRIEHLTDADHAIRPGNGHGEHRAHRDRVAFRGQFGKARIGSGIRDQDTPPRGGHLTGDALLAAQAGPLVGIHDLVECQMELPSLARGVRQENVAGFGPERREGEITHRLQDALALERLIELGGRMDEASFPAGVDPRRAILPAIS
jgi:hypothetical protein